MALVYVAWIYTGAAALRHEHKPANSQNEENKWFLRGLCSPATANTAVGYTKVWLIYVHKKRLGCILARVSIQLKKSGFVLLVLFISCRHNSRKYITSCCCNVIYSIFKEQFHSCYDMLYLSWRLKTVGDTFINYGHNIKVLETHPCSSSRPRSTWRDDTNVFNMVWMISLDPVREHDCESQHDWLTCSRLDFD